MSIVSKSQYLLRNLIVIVVSAIFAAWSKMLFPRLSIGYWRLWTGESLRNKIGFLVSMPLLELFYLGYLYILSAFIYAIIFYWWQVVRNSQSVAALIGMLVSTTVYSVYKLNFYLKSTRIYDAHRGTYPSKPWYTWVEYPEDVELLFIYAITGLVGGWLYYHLINRQRLIGTIST